MRPEFSIIIPFYNEEESVVAVLEEVRRCQPEAEIIAVDDGSSDATWEKICSVQGIRGLRPSANRGQSAAMYAGLQRATAPVVGLMDGDGQNDPADFAKLLSAMNEGVDVVVGYRAKRKDTFSRRAASKIANRIRRMFLDDGVRDTGCSLKVFRREAVQYLVPFNGLHRYLPAIFKKAGLRIAEVPVNHRPRELGVSKYTNWDRALRGIYDLIGVSWLLKRKVHYPSIEENLHD
ncbi:glycosyltransferase family 2 protein [Ruficoccus amylovorans]|uniref:Glycosyltransferase family 2 protein n=1 Tax=Ruficoccus amylovorans TaxID=1804625 RepID=A0A842HBS3_9BACT|nr:glycosyltransferase family 2 protein [Ruficoccus amylovorans]MBC2593913.1 glycosyltransferase family 2 protein [Ruficoccus amylovorans]